MNNNDNQKIKFGRVVLVGRPNTGKSSLINAIMNQKVTITSPLPQTTRKNIRVVYSDPRGKFIISDTPGIINKVEDLIGKMVNLEAPKEVNNADVIVVLTDISRSKSEEENKVIGIVRKLSVPKILVYNKMDIALGSKDHLAEYNYLEEEFDGVITISAIKNKNIKGLVSEIFKFLPEVDRESVDDQTRGLIDEKKPIISMGSKEFIAEIIREKAYLFLREELPYSIQTQVIEVKDKKKLVYVKAVILTNADRYKKMIIGKNGQKIKEIGFNARKELELMSGRKVFLELNVETDKHWMERVIN